MLSVGQLRSRDCQQWTRRALLRVGTLSLAGLGSAGPGAFDDTRLFAKDAAARGDSQQVAPAKSVVLIWLWGGPSHLDSFDMKPKAPIEYRGPYSPIATSVPGIEVCELLPHLAKQADRYSIIRSMKCESNDHGIAGTIGLTGSTAGAASLSGQVLPGRLKPTHGAIASKTLSDQLGSAPLTPDRSPHKAGARGAEMPRFITVGGHLHQGKRAITGEGAAGLGPIHDPFRMDYHPERGIEIPDLALADGLTPSGIDSREYLLARFDQLARRVEQSSASSRLDAFYQQAFSLLTKPEARNVFDLEKETEQTRLRYGRFRFGQCCLLARRLVESGSRFVQVNWSSHVEPVEDTGDGGWDMHDRHFQQYQDRHAWMIDQAASALLDDLHERGLLSQTVVVLLGEFGRTPKINNKSGRDHWEHCYSAVVAGGGFRAGHVVGASDRLAEYPVSRPVHPADLFTTIFQQMGITTTSLTTSGLIPQGNVVEELL